MCECLNRTCWHTLESVPYTLDRQCQWQAFLNFINVFLLFRYYLPIELLNGPYLKKLKSLSPMPKMLYAKFGWTWLSGSGEDDFFNFVNVFSLFRSYIHLEKDRGLYLNIKLEFPLPKGLLCRSGEFEVLIVRYAISRHVA